MGRGKKPLNWYDWPLFIISIPFIVLIHPIVWVYDHFFLAKGRGK